jgi:protein involved in polysaccharide export with SLBB domain
MPKTRNDCYEMQERGELMIIFQAAAVIVDRKGVLDLPLVKVLVLINRKIGELSNEIKIRQARVSFFPQSYLLL